LMARLKEYIERKRQREGGLLFSNVEGNVEGTICGSCKPL